MAYCAVKCFRKCLTSTCQLSFQSPAAVMPVNQTECDMVYFSVSAAGQACFFVNVIHSLLKFSPCASPRVRYCEYSGVHRADSRGAAPSRAACSAVGTLRQPHRCLRTGRERSCHQVGAHRIMINATNKSFSCSYLCLKYLPRTAFYSTVFESYVLKHLLGQTIIDQIIDSDCFFFFCFFLIVGMKIWL